MQFLRTGEKKRVWKLQRTVDSHHVGVGWLGCNAWQASLCARNHCHSEVYQRTPRAWLASSALVWPSKPKNRSALPRGPGSSWAFGVQYRQRHLVRGHGSSATGEISRTEMVVKAMKIFDFTTSHMIVGFSLVAQVAGFIGLSWALHPGPVRLAACAGVAVCAAFAAAVVANLSPAPGVLLCGAWLIGSITQVGCLMVVLARPEVSRNRFMAVATLVASNCMNFWFGIDFFTAVISRV